MNIQAQSTRRRAVVGGTLAALAVTGGAVAGPAQAAGAPPAGSAAVESVVVDGVVADGVVAPMASCGYARTHETSGAKAYWQLSCVGGNVTVSGWVEDTASDGQCARVKAQFHNSQNWKYSEPACPKGERQSFGWTEPGSGANVYLYEYTV
ncbi:hypothetical protein [Saccharothrix xinjiangensis]|uniref:Secreted protein n=1 Tax=Saccharothrix xinjiangensis TaxID=204798 RepID=A0ABV9Y9M2_9PSEU